jgi:hypothetical protein
VKRLISSLLIVGSLLGPSPLGTPDVTGGALTGPPGREEAVSRSVQEATPWARYVSMAVDRAVSLMAWAEARFEAAGLTMPADIDLILCEGKDRCGGNLAAFKGSGAGGEIDLCLDADAPIAAFRRILLHELSHAWTARNLSEETKEAFLVLRGLEFWGEPAPWERKGTEHAAEIMAWGLFDTQIGVAAIYPNDTASLTEAFRFLTGTDPICGRK